jgi:hypothetical protein
VPVDDDGNTIDIASASIDELRRARDHVAGLATSLRREAKSRRKHDAKAAEWLEEAKQHDRLAAYLHEQIATRDPTS